MRIANRYERVSIMLISLLGAMVIIGLVGAVIYFGFIRRLRGINKDPVNGSTDSLEVLTPLVIIIGIFMALNLISTVTDTVQGLSHDKITVTSALDASQVKEDTELNGSWTNDSGKHTSKAQDVIVTSTFTNADISTKVLWSIGKILPSLALVIVSLCLLPMVRAMNSGETPLTLETTRHVLKAAWIMVIAMPIASTAAYMANLTAEQAFLGEGVGTFGPGITAGVFGLVIAGLLRRGARAVELEEATV